MTTKHLFATGIALLSLGLAAQATTYSGNGNNGFGGPIGDGSLTLTDDGTTLTGTVTKGPNGFNDVLVIYIDTVAGGFTTSAGFTDSGDGLRKAISGFDGGSNRSTLNFAAGFAPDYAIALGPASDSFGGLWTLVDGGSHTFDSSVNLTPTGTTTAATYTFSLSLASIGLTPGAGQSFELFGTYISNSGYRADEAVAGTETGAQGWGNTITQTGFGTFTTTAVPEPSMLALSAISGLATLYMLRRRN
ncbi:MAG: PEP-CTERM sorting domain-containing protein [Verrucomicrobiae bacterium]|nr:PEP-CTERM sorting domain-containing protein [Verrucomicrobiae bacterium]